MTTRLFAVLTVIPLLVACAVATPEERRTAADRLGSEAALAPLTIRTADFDLHARLRAEPGSRLLVIFIEGDGFAWKRTDERSTDPTPLNPVALTLAARDPSPAVAWLARPCQFTGGETARGCNSDLWTGARYSERVIAASNEAIGILKQKAGASRIALVGYSGGGAVAALVAMRRDDVAWLKTVAAPLDTEAFTAHHRATPLAASLNPAVHAARLAALPQIHYAGADDDIVPPSINRSFPARMDETRCIALKELPGVSHGKGWEEAWSDIGAEIPACH
ncbi:MAG: hypothetical protein KF765_13600 [Parvibaculaceae bacterium]|nr:hypothetical protein [Parvibaculaceae bacterium]